jgi:hypothetical protein
MIMKIRILMMILSGVVSLTAQTFTSPYRQPKTTGYGNNGFGSQSGFSGQNSFGNRNSFGSQNSLGNQNTFGSQSTFGNRSAFSSPYTTKVYDTQNGFRSLTPKQGD